MPLQTKPLSKGVDLKQSFDLDQRRYIRYEVLDYANIFVSDGQESWQAVVVDIGLGGVQVRSRANFPIGEKCMLQVGRLDLPPLMLKGEIRHSMPVDQSDLFACGIRFLPETHEERIAIAEYVHGVFQRQCDLLST